MVREHGYAHCVIRSCVRCSDYRQGAEYGRNKVLLDLVKLAGKGHRDGCECELHKVAGAVAQDQRRERLRMRLLRRGRLGPRDADTT